MKKILVLSLLAIATTLNAAVFSLTSTTNSVYLVSTNRASVYSINVTSPYECSLKFYDCDTIAAPYYGSNYVNAAYVSKSNYSTNIASSYIGFNGYTNWVTNTVLWTVSTTNTAATNQLPRMAEINIAPNTYAVYDVDLLFARGISVLATTNATVTINYRPAK